MAGNTFGTLFQVTTFGESHGPALGVTIDGFPAGILFDTAFIQSEMNRRRPGANSLGTSRNEGDEIEVYASYFFGRNSISEINVCYQNVSDKITPEQQALLNRNNPHQYPNEREFYEGKRTKNSKIVSYIPIIYVNTTQT